MLCNGVVPERTPQVFSAMLLCTSGYATVAVIMPASPQAVAGSSYHPHDAANVTQRHLSDMFASTFITGKMIARSGTQKKALTGNSLYCSHVIVGSYSDYPNGTMSASTFW